MLVLLMKYTKQGTCFKQVDTELVAQGKWSFSHYRKICLVPDDGFFQFVTS